MGVRQETVAANGHKVIESFSNESVRVERGRLGEQVVWRGLIVRFQSETPEGYLPRVAEVTEEWEPDDLPDPLKWSMSLLEIELRETRGVERDYLLIDTEDSKNFLRIEAREEGKFTIYTGEKSKKRTAFWKKNMPGGKWKPTFLHESKKSFTSMWSGSCLEVLYDPRTDCFSLRPGRP